LLPVPAYATLSLVWLLRVCRCLPDRWLCRFTLQLTGMGQDGLGKNLIGPIDLDDIVLHEQGEQMY